MRFFNLKNFKIMIYKFIDELENPLEVKKSGNDVIFSLKEDNNFYMSRLNKNQLYDLIGALHSIQTKIKNEKNY